MAKEYLLKIGWPPGDAEHVSKCISSHRFRGNNAPETVEAKILFDADKLDAIGCLGIARTLMYEGTVGSELYEIKNGEICFGENKDDKETFLKEYNTKLKNLYDKFNTKQAEEIAKTEREYAQLFYDKLAKQIVGAYSSKELLDKFINTP